MAHPAKRAAFSALHTIPARLEDIFSRGIVRSQAGLGIHFDANCFHRSEGQMLQLPRSKRWRREKMIEEDYVPSYRQEHFRQAFQKRPSILTAKCVSCE